MKEEEEKEEKRDFFGSIQKWPGQTVGVGS
jgi:hypothetical protein